MADPPRGPASPGGDVVLAPSPNWHAAHVLSWAPCGTALAVAAHQSVLLVWPGGGGGSSGPADPATNGGGPHTPSTTARQAILGAHAGRVTAVACVPGDDGAATTSAADAPPPLLVASAGTDRALRLWNAHARRCAASATKLKSEPSALAWVGGGDTLRLAVGFSDGGLATWRPAALRPSSSAPSSSRPAPVPGWEKGPGGGVTALAADNAGGAARLAVGCGDGSVWLVRLEGEAAAAPSRLWSHAPGSPVQGLAWARPGTPASVLASGGGDGRVLVGAVGGDGSPGPTTLTPQAGPATPAARRQWTAVTWIASSPTTWWLVASAGPGGGLAAWPAGDVVDGSPPPPTLLPAGHTRVVFGLAPCPARAAPCALASASMDRTLRVWRTAPDRRKGGPPLRPSASLPGLGGHAFSLALARRTATAAVAVGDGSVRVWALSAGGGTPPPGSAGPLWRGVPAHPTAVSWWEGGGGPGAPPHPILAVGGSDGGVGLLDPGSGSCVRLSPGGSGAAAAAAPVAAVAWLPATPGPPSLLALHADGRLERWGGDAIGAAAAAAASAGGKGGRSAQAAPTARPSDFPGEEGGPAWAALRADSGGDAPACLAVVAWQGARAPVVAVALGGRAGGVHVSTQTVGSRPHLWTGPDAGTPHGAGVTAVAWRDGGGGVGAALPSRPWLASVGEDGALAAHPPSAEPAAVLRGDGRALTAVAWSGHGGDALLRLAAGRADGSLLVARVVQATAGWAVQPTHALARHGGPVRGLAWLTGDAALLSASDDHSVRLWAVAAAGEAQQLAPPPPPTATATAPSRRAAAAAAATAAFTLGPAPLAPPLPPPDPAADAAELAALAEAWGVDGWAGGGPTHHHHPHPTGRLGVHAHTSSGAAALSSAAADEEEAASVDASNPAAAATSTRRAAALRLWAGDAAGAARTLLATPATLDAHAVALAAAAGRGAWVAAARAYAASLAAAGDAAGAAVYLAAAGDVPAAVRALARGGRPADAAALAAARLPRGHPVRVGVSSAAAARAAGAGEGARAAAAWLDAGEEERAADAAVSSGAGGAG